jgi:hypothetical protein
MSVTERMHCILTAVLVLLLAGCTIAPRPSSVIDCGMADEGRSGTYDPVGRECFWSAYSAAQPARWAVTTYTNEGDPMPQTISFNGSAIVVTRDASSDRFSSERDRRIWTWSCRTMMRRAWATDAQRFSFELSGCTGDGAAVSFP